MHMFKLPGVATPIAVDSITHIQSAGGYSWVHYQPDGRQLLARTIKAIAAQLPGFIRSHKTSLINPTHIAHVRNRNRRGMSIQLSNGVVLAVAQHRVKRVSEQLYHLTQRPTEDR